MANFMTSPTTAKTQVSSSDIVVGTDKQQVARGNRHPGQHVAQIRSESRYRSASPGVMRQEVSAAATA